MHCFAILRVHLILSGVFYQGYGNNPQEYVATQGMYTLVHSLISIIKFVIYMYNFGTSGSRIA